MSKAALCTLVVMGGLVLVCWLRTTRWRAVKWQLVQRPLKFYDPQKDIKDQ